jgi:tRNA-specific adenosine deaminase 3
MKQAMEDAANFNSFCKNLLRPSNNLENEIINISDDNCIVDFDGAIMVNPKTQQVVMTSSDAVMYMKANLLSHGLNMYLSCPLYTPTMLCIEGVAACVRGDIEDAKETPENYVCSGLDLYVVKEPDIMDSMALVHSRIRHVYFLSPRSISDGGGGLTTFEFNISAIRSLNHHYRVFRMTERLEN